MENLHRCLLKPSLLVGDSIMQVATYNKDIASLASAFCFNFNTCFCYLAFLQQNSFSSSLAITVLKSTSLVCTSIIHIRL